MSQAYKRYEKEFCQKFQMVESYPSNSPPLGIIIVEAIIEIAKVVSRRKARGDRTSVGVIGAKDLGRLLRHELGYIIAHGIHASAMMVHDDSGPVSSTKSDAVE